MPVSTFSLPGNLVSSERASIIPGKGGEITLEGKPLMKPFLKTWTYISRHHLLISLYEQWFNRAINMQTFQTDPQLEIHKAAMGVGATVCILLCFMLYGFGYWGTEFSVHAAECSVYAGMHIVQS